MNNKTIFLLLSHFVFLSINANAATYTVTKISDVKSQSIAEIIFEQQKGKQ